MSIDSNVPALYRGKINLWVEDTLTKEYLKEIWEADPDISFLSVARWQVANNTVPTELKELRTALRQRVDLQ